MKSLERECPVCRAEPGKLCFSTIPGGEGKRMARVHYARVPSIQVPCPVCKAPIDQACQISPRDAKVGMSFHAKRIMAAELAELSGGL